MSIHGVLILTNFDYKKTERIVLVSPDLNKRWRIFYEEKYCSQFIRFNEETVQEYLKRERF